VARVHSTPLPTFQGLSAARSKARERQIALEGVIHRVFGFILIAGFVFMVSSMMGNVMLEKASRDARQDLRRLNVAGKVVGVIRDQVDGLSQSAALDKWALNHNFYNPQAQAVYNGQSTQ
jgi:hypothetical protein